MIARRALWAGILSMLVWPLSYAWLPLGDISPGWVFVLVLAAEVSAIILGALAVGSGVRAWRREGQSAAARWAVALGALTLTLVITGNVLGVVLLS